MLVSHSTLGADTGHFPFHDALPLRIEDFTRGREVEGHPFPYIVALAVLGRALHQIPAGVTLNSQLQGLGHAHIVGPRLLGHNCHTHPVRHTHDTLTCACPATLARPVGRPRSQEIPLRAE